MSTRRTVRVLAHPYEDADEPLEAAAAHVARELGVDRWRCAGRWVDEGCIGIDVDVIVRADIVYSIDVSYRRPGYGYMVSQPVSLADAERIMREWTGVERTVSVSERQVGNPIPLWTYAETRESDAALAARKGTVPL